MRAAKNDVYIEGILSEIDLKTGSFKKDGQEKEYISGQIKVRVDLPDNQLEIPISLFSNRMTSKGELNPSYLSIERVKNEMISIAASDEERADRVRLTGYIRMNEYYGRDGRLVSYPRINTGFVNKVKKESMKPRANFNIQFMVESMGYEIDANGDETDTYFVRGIVPYYGDNVDVITFHAANANVRDAISQYWEAGNCVEAEGRLNFTSVTKTTMVTPDFGEPHEETRTFSVSEILITGGRAEPLDDTMAWDVSEIQNALTARKERINNTKNSGSTTSASAPARPKIDLGF